MDDINDINFEKNIFNFIDSINVMVLATSIKKEGIIYSYSTPLFFARENNVLYFVSDKDSNHSQHIIQNPYVSASITKNYSNYNEIRGVQLWGYCNVIDSLYNAISAALIYFKKFSNINFFHPEIIKKTLNINWYKLVINKLIYTDNTIRFGFKHKLHFFSE